jgi:hypothetical protein
MWVEGKVRRQRARVVAVNAVVTDVDNGRTAPDEVIDQLADEIIAMHNERYHPGYGCAENTLGECFDRFGGERADGPLGEYWRLT